MPHAPRTSKLARGAIVGLAAAQAGATQLARSAKKLVQRGASEADQEAARAEHEAKLGRIAFTALNQLKGTALKASQLLSMELGLLPEGVRQQLTRAQYQVTPLNRALVLKLLRQELGDSPEALFADFDLQAFAAASLGQVHAATLFNGESVAVKLQYPGMAATIQSDLSLLGLLLKGLGPETPPSDNIQAQMMDNIAQTLTRELDYLHEAQELQWFAQHLQHPHLVVPQPVMDRTTPRVLTMQRLHGLHLAEWLTTQPSQAQRDHYGQLLFDTFMQCAWGLQRLQADPHAGNYLFMDEGQLGLLDFGCTRTLSPAFCAQAAIVWKAALRRPKDTAALRHAYLALELIDPALDLHRFETALLPALAGWQDWQCLPLQSAVYDFGQLPPPPQPDSAARRTATHYLRAVPPDLPHFDRAHLGLTQMLRSLGARVRTRNPWIF
jgi:predicted unusual protein kinase regulating ubiquinone biosynthesis (AarF/ABC1/UbiB family)